MPSNKLTYTMLEALNYARQLWQQTPLKRQLGGNDRDGWFYAQFTTRGSIDFFCRPQTLAALYRRGYLEERITYYGDGTVFREYRLAPEHRKESDYA